MKMLWKNIKGAAASFRDNLLDIRHTYNEIIEQEALIALAMFYARVGESFAREAERISRRVHQPRNIFAHMCGETGPNKAHCRLTQGHAGAHGDGIDTWQFYAASHQQ